MPCACKEFAETAANKTKTRGVRIVLKWWLLCGLTSDMRGERSAAERVRLDEEVRRYGGETK